MGIRGRFISLLVAGALLSAPLAPASADHEDGLIEIPSIAQWDHFDLSVLIVPPNHGQIFNGEGGVLGGEDPGELTPFNSYLVAIEDAITAWNDAVHTLGTDALKEAYQPKVYVLGRDDVPQDVLLKPDILVITDESEGGSLGTAIRLEPYAPCVVRMSKIEIMSFSYADMYNVTAQEFGHCLGLQHVGSQAGVDPTSEQKHPEHDVMNGFYTHFVGDADTHLHCISNLDIMGLEHVFGLPKRGPGLLWLGAHGLSYMPVDAYGDTCEHPPSDWRRLSPPTINTDAPAMESKVVTPSSGTVVAGVKHVTGTTSVDSPQDDFQWMTQVGLAKVVDEDTCAWWDRATKAFVERDCYSPVWTDVDFGDEEWRWRAPAKLEPGNYRAVSRITTNLGNEQCCLENLSEFRIKANNRERTKGKANR